MTDLGVLAPSWVEPCSPDEGAARATALFERSFGGPPACVASAPGRVTLIGEHTDYAAGLSVATVTTHGTFVAARVRDDDAVRIVSGEGDDVPGPGPRWEGSLPALEPGSVTGWPAYAAGVLWAFEERGYPVRGVDLAVETTLPPGAGLAASASFTIAVARAVAEACGIALAGPRGERELAEACWEAERRFVGRPVGRLDPYAIVQCREDESVLLDFAQRPPVVQAGPLYLHDYGLRLLVIDTRHRTPDWADSYANRRKDAERAAAALGVPNLRAIADMHHPERKITRLEDERLARHALHVVTEIGRVRAVAALLNGLAPAEDRFTEIGDLLLATHASLRDDYHVSTDALDLAVRVAVREGALGGRLIGAGWGGAAMALVRAVDARRIGEAVDREFAEVGKDRPRLLLA
ncbi:galactokinase [Demequina pelophila]|uniref:galactokinase n=1 Tax=Demequina pelophila TaxID=1638984 RepID=UPI000782B55D|nr:galactokinase family protein [Demequina pelophila]